MKIGHVSSNKMIQTNFWLTGSFYLSKAEAFRQLISRRNPQKLGEVLAKHPFYGSRGSRIYVEDKYKGIPYLSNSDMLSVSPLSQCKYVSKKLTANIQNDLLQSGWTLVSRVGTIGQVAYVRRDFEGAAGSDNIFRLIPSDEIPSGYLYTYMSSPIGIELQKQLASGGVQDYIDGKNLSEIPIPRLDQSHEKEIHRLIEQAAELRVKANSALQAARKLIEEEIDFTSYSKKHDHAYSVEYSKLDLLSPFRLDSFYYSGYCAEALRTLEKYPGKVMSAKDVGYRIYNPPLFKRQFAESGYPYMSGVDFYNLRPKTDRFLSKKQQDVDLYLVRKGMVLIQSAGQRYGLITTPLMVTRVLDGVAITSDVVRIDHADIVENGYICGLFGSEFGRRLVLRYSYGTSIPRLDVPEFSNIKIPWPEDEVRRNIGQIVVDAYQQYDIANELEDRAQIIFADTLGNAL